MSFRLSAEVGVLGKIVALTLPGNCCAHAARALSIASKTTANRFADLFNVVPLRLEPLNVTHKLRTAGECVRELAFISRTEIGEIETR